MSTNEKLTGIRWNADRKETNRKKRKSRSYYVNIPITEDQPALAVDNSVNCENVNYNLRKRQKKCDLDHNDPRFNDTDDNTNYDISDSYSDESSEIDDVDYVPNSRSSQRNIVTSIIGNEISSSPTLHSYKWGSASDTSENEPIMMTHTQTENTYESISSSNSSDSDSSGDESSYEETKSSTLKTCIPLNDYAWASSSTDDEK
jgi:hypothetical protein